MPTIAPTPDALATALGLRVEVEPARGPGRGRRGNSLEVWYVYADGRCLGSFVPGTRSLWHPGFGCVRCGSGEAALRLFAAAEKGRARG